MIKAVRTHRTCKICNLTKEILLCVDDENMCLNCKRNQNREWSKNNREKLNIYRREYMKSKAIEWALDETPRKCECCEKTRPTKEFSLLRNDCQECVEKWTRNYEEGRKGCPKRIEWARKYEEKRKNSPERLEWKRVYAPKEKIRSKIYQQAHKDKIREYHKKYNEENREKNNEYLRNRAKSDPQYRLKKTISSRIRKELKLNGVEKNGRTETMVGCSTQELKDFLAVKFQAGMTWDNYWKQIWQIDHIVPVEFFDITDERELKRCFHYTNLQPLWTTDNNQKSDYHLGISWRTVPRNVKNISELTEMIEELYNIE